MPPTTLAFHRKRQNLDHLALERPQNLQNFYEAIEEELKHIETQLKYLELDYYGYERTPEDEVKEWMPALDIVMNALRPHISFLYSKQQLKDIFDLYDRSIGDPTMEVDFDKEAVQTVLDCIHKIDVYLRHRFKQIIDAIFLILGYMRKYCLSFCGTSGDNYLETATNYEKQRRELADAIKINVEDIPMMADRFDSVDGIKMHEFGSVPKKIAEKCGCSNVPFLVSFAGACENVRNACIGVRKWIQADDGYATFIQFDITDLERKKETCDKLKKDLQIKVSHLDHRMKMCKRDIQECVIELKRVAAKEKSLRKQEEQILEEIHEIDVDLELKEIQKDELRKKTSLDAKEREKLERINSDIEHRKTKKPILERKAEDLKRKVEFLTFRRDLKGKRESQAKGIKDELREARREFKKTDYECERLEKNISKLREIHRFKTSTEVLKKLFYNMPLNKGQVGGAARKRKGQFIDKLERATRITASLIDKDWIHLYRNLPFHPPRGEENLRADIEDVVTTFLRDTAEVHAKQSLYRWRRVNTRANLDDLKKSLMIIKRKDIVDKMEEENDKEEDAPSKTKTKYDCQIS
ncbi:hypothetical protein FSP39_014455 [Pinctada imbricata]|uniref:Death domain-containing protein n=1 Tax=Pinctada imbricata TaxID=66713 RepID=A0AA88YVF1_PINIB|nr:hypothetical protein FSP39_014455 [Pinctada imbricata]